jgi:hypothetical protein
MPDDKRRAALTRRLQKLQIFWRDESSFSAVVTSGRYLKLCEATESIFEALEKLACEESGTKIQQSATDRGRSSW